MAALGGRNGQSARPHQARGRGCTALRGAEIRQGRGRSRRKPEARHRQPAQAHRGRARNRHQNARGFEGIERSFIALLERNGITRQDPTGAAFDANLHQAMAEQESAEHPPGTVLQAWSQTWPLNGRLLRPAMVVVSKQPG